VSVLFNIRMFDYRHISILLVFFIAVYKCSDYHFSPKTVVLEVCFVRIPKDPRQILGISVDTFLTPLLHGAESFLRS